MKHGTTVEELTQELKHLHLPEVRAQYEDINDWYEETEFVEYLLDKACDEAGLDITEVYNNL